jgi:ankyrin repeat protein
VSGSINLLELSDNNEQTQSIPEDDNSKPILPSHLIGVPLYSMAEKGDVKSVKILMASGANIAAKDDKYGWTALHWAAMNGHKDVVTLLLDRDPNMVAAKDKNYGRTPLHLAVMKGMKGHEDVVALLLDRMDPNMVAAKDWFGVRTALHYAALNGRRDAVALLLERNLNMVTAEDDLRQTVLHCAAMRGHKDVVALLLDRIDPSMVAAKDDKYLGRTALEWAVMKGHKDVVALLEKWGA